MAKGFPILLIILLIIIIGFLIGFYRTRESSLTPLPTNKIAIPDTLDKTTKSEEFLANTFTNWVETFLLTKNNADISSVVSEWLLTSYLVTAKKIIQEKKVLTQEKRDQIDVHLDVFLWLLYENIKARPELSKDVATFRSAQEFQRFFRDIVLQGKAKDMDMDISEIIAGNISYCSRKDTFPDIKDQQACIAQIKFFYSKSSQDCNSIDSNGFPGLRMLCEDYFKSIR